MDLATLVASLTDEKVKVTTLTAERDAATAQVTTLTADLTAQTALVAERDATIETLTAERDAALQAVKPEPATEAVLAFVADLCKRTLVANGNQTPELPDTVEKQIEAIKEGQAKLSALIPAGGRASNPLFDVEDRSNAAPASGAFRRAK